MPRRPVFLTSVVVLILGQPRAAFSQQPPPIAEVTSLLREASALLPRIDASQRVTAAANIAAQQTRAGDDEGALASRTVVSASDQPGAVGGVAYSLAAQGRLPQALQLIATVPDGQQKASALWQITHALLTSAKYEDALIVARLISADPAQSNLFLDTLLQIYGAQFKAGDQQHAAVTLDEALNAVEREPEIPPGMSKPMPTILVFSHKPAMFGSIVHALVLAGNVNTARTVLARLSAMAAKEQDPEKRKGILGPLAAAQADVGDVSTALRTIEPIKSDFFVQTYVTEIAIVQAQQGEVAAALATLSSVPQGFTLQQMSRALSGIGNYAGARTAVDKIEDAEQRAYGLADLAFEQADKDPAGAKLNVASAWKLAQEARSQAPPYVFQNAVTFVAATRARLGDFAGALEIINGPDLQSKSWPLAVLAQAMVGSGQKDAALALARSQAEPPTRANALLQIATSLMDQIETANKKAPAPKAIKDIPLLNDLK